jgi:hypothetical protein
MARPPAGGIATTTALTGSDQGVLTGGGVFYGGTFYESGASSTATATIYDGTAASGTVIAYISLAAGAVTNLSIANGVQVISGIYVDVGGSGTVAGSIYSAS